VEEELELQGHWRPEMVSRLVPLESFRGLVLCHDRTHCVRLPMFFLLLLRLTNISGTCPHDPPIRVLAMPAATMLFAIGVELLLVDILRIMKVPSPCRISSLPVGAPLRPGIYAYIEDICAVDGSGGTEFRQRLNLRYQASKAFREMLHRLTLFWAIGAIVCSIVTTIIVFTIQRDAAYVVSTFLIIPPSNF
jgi:hypothetical protein